MLVPISRQHFGAFDDAQLVWACVEPTISKIRGKDIAVKLAESSGLNEAQRALLLFQVLYGHSGYGLEGLFSQLSYLLRWQGFWEQLARMAALFGDDTFLGLLDRLNRLYFSQYGEAARHGPAKETAIPSPQADELDGELRELLPGLLKRVAATIRSNPGLFIEFVD